jgi:hypothetical protein
VALADALAVVVPSVVVVPVVVVVLVPVVVVVLVPVVPVVVVPVVPVVVPVVVVPVVPVVVPVVVPDVVPEVVPVVVPVVLGGSSTSLSSSSRNWLMKMICIWLQSVAWMFTPPEPPPSSCAKAGPPRTYIKKMSPIDANAARTTVLRLPTKIEASNLFHITPTS